MQKIIEKKLDLKNKIEKRTQKIAETFFKSRVTTTEIITNGASDKSVTRLYFDGFTVISIYMPSLTTAIKEKIEKLINFFHSIDISAPKIYLFDKANKTILLEDFGKNAVDTICNNLPSKIKEIYPVAINVLSKIHSNSSSTQFLTTETKQLLIDHFKLFCEEFVKSDKKNNFSEQEISDYTNYISMQLDLLPEIQDVVTIHDYHSPNIFWLKERSSIKRIGIIDLQDTTMYSPALDLVSIIEDARVTIDLQTRKSLLETYLEASKLNAHFLRQHYYLLGLIRSCKVLGFASKMHKKGEVRYSSLIDRAKKYIMENKILKQNNDFSNWIKKTLHRK